MDKCVKKGQKRPPAFPVLWCRVIIELLLIYQVSSRVCYSDGNLGTLVCQTARSVNVRDQRTFYLCQVLYRKFSEISFNLSHKLVNSSSLHFNVIHDDVIIYDSQMAFHMKCKMVWSWKWPPTLETFEWFIFFEWEVQEYSAFVVSVDYKLQTGGSKSVCYVSLRLSHMWVDTTYLLW